MVSYVDRPEDALAQAAKVAVKVGIGGSFQYVAWM